MCFQKVCASSVIIAFSMRDFTWRICDRVAVDVCMSAAAEGIVFLKRL